MKIPSISVKSTPATQIASYTASPPPTSDRATLGAYKTSTAFLNITTMVALVFGSSAWKTMADWLNAHNASPPPAAASPVEKASVKPSPAMTEQRLKERILDEMIQPETLMGPTASEARTTLRRDLIVMPRETLQFLQWHSHRYVILQGGKEGEQAAAISVSLDEHRLSVGYEGQRQGLVDSGVLKERKLADYRDEETKVYASKIMIECDKIDKELNPQLEKAKAELLEVAKEKQLRKRVQELFDTLIELDSKNGSNYQKTKDELDKLAEGDKRLREAMHKVYHLYLEKANRYQKAASEISHGRLSALFFDPVVIQEGSLSGNSPLVALPWSRGIRQLGQLQDYLQTVLVLNPSIDVKNSNELSEATLQELHISRLVFPNVSAVRQLSSGKSVVLSSFDALANQEWMNLDRHIGGLYYPNYGTAFLCAEKVGLEYRDNNISIHETFHAILDSLDDLDHDYYVKFTKKLDEAYKRAKAKKEFVTEYAGENQDEFFAESGAALYSSINGPKLKALDPQWHKDMLGLISHIQGFVIKQEMTEKLKPFMELLSKLPWTK